METPNKRIIQVKILGATNTKGTRIKLIESRYNTTDTFTMSYDYRHRDMADQAIEYLENKGIKIEGKGDFNGATFLFSNSWADNTEFIAIH